jgi:hypothetical protein
MKRVLTVFAKRILDRVLAARAPADPLPPILQDLD